MNHLLTKASLLLVALAVHGSLSAQTLRAGIIGCDTSHVPAFTKVINDSKAQGALAQVEVVVAYPGGSPDLAASRDRVEGYTEELRAAGVEIVDSIEQLMERCDVVLLESVDGRVHLEQFRKAAKGKPVFIDKPAAASLADVIAIGQIARETNTPCFSSSALRYCEAVTKLASERGTGKPLGCDVASPYKVEPTHSDFVWYGVHGVESVFALMGTGCEEVQCTETESAAVVVGKWSDGRLATYRGIKQGKADYNFTVFGTRRVESAKGFSGYQPLVTEVCEFFVSREVPVPWEETVEIFAFMEGARLSREQGGKPIHLASLIEEATPAP
jgi:predicted dehydrogenase